MTEYTELDAHEKETHEAWLDAEQALRDHQDDDQPVAQTVVDVTKPLKIFGSPEERAAEKEKLKASERATHAAWEAAVAANPRNQR